MISKNKRKRFKKTTKICDGRSHKVTETKERRNVLISCDKCRPGRAQSHVGVKHDQSVFRFSFHKLWESFCTSLQFQLWKTSHLQNNKGKNVETPFDILEVLQDNGKLSLSEALI